MLDRKNSFTAASNDIPVKLLHNKIIDEKGNIIPKYVMIYPTNKCNIECKVCFCDKRDKNLELPIERAKHIIDIVKDLGCEAISLSGGGDPTCYKHLNELLHYIKDSGIETSITTNGLNLEVLDDRSLKDLTWCRISAVTERRYDFDKLKKIVNKGKNVDWGFSYVLASDENYENVKQIIEFANENNFKYVRITGNVVDKGNKSYIKSLEDYLEKNNVKQDLIIKQTRNYYTDGAKNCYVSLLRPSIAADGNVYPCCSIHYSTEPPTYDYVHKLCSAEELPEFIKQQKFFDGSKCVRCDFSHYNKFLENYKKEVVHKKFL